MSKYAHIWASNPDVGVGMGGGGGRQKMYSNKKKLNIKAITILSCPAVSFLSFYSEKFRHLDDDIKPCSSLLAEKKWPTTKKRLVLDQSSQPKSQRGQSKRPLDISGGEAWKKSNQS